MTNLFQDGDSFSFEGGCLVNLKMENTFMAHAALMYRAKSKGDVVFFELLSTSIAYPKSFHRVVMD